MTLATHFHLLAVLVVLLLTIAVNAIFGGVVLARTYRKIYGWYFAFTLLGVACWAAGDLLLLLAKTPDLVRLGAELFYIGPLFIPIFIWFFAISFPDTRALKAWHVLVAAVSCLTFSALFLLNLDTFAQIQITAPGSMNIATPQPPGFLAYAFHFSLFFMLTYAAFFFKRQKLKGLSRVQVTYTFYGALIASLPALVTNLSLPVMGTRSLIWLGPVFTLFFAGAVTLAIVRHRLFDIRPVIVRSLGYALSIITVSAVYGFLIFGAAQVLFNQRFALEVQIAFSAATGIAALSFQSFKNYFDKLTRHLFYRDAYDSQEFFDEFNKVLVSTIDINTLLARVTDTIAKYVKAQYCLVGIKDGSEYGRRIVGTQVKKFTEQDIDDVRRATPHLHQVVILTDDLGTDHEPLRRLLLKNDIAMLARLTADYHKTKEGLGYIVLGPKKSGNPYNTQDIRVMEAVANELIIAIQNAVRFEEIREFNETLQQRIKEATQRLSETNKKLKAMDETKDDFIGMASHQLRTPLTSVKGYLSLVLDGDAGKITSQQRKLLTQAFISSQRMVFLIADLLNVSRLKTGKFVIETAPVNLADMVMDEVNQLKETAAARELTLEFHRPAHFPAIDLDETKTRQVVMNFLDNAVYYTPSGGHITAELIETPKSVELRVHDNGIGVPKAEQHHLFSKFYRAKNAQKARPDGTGLGLFMAKKVIIAQGGAILFDSKEGEGSTFGFMFPKKRPPVTMPADDK